MTFFCTILSFPKHPMKVLDIFLLARRVALNTISPTNILLDSYYVLLEQRNSILI